MKKEVFTGTCIQNQVRAVSQLRLRALRAALRLFSVLT